jgi:hypothetical protein
LITGGPMPADRGLPTVERIRDLSDNYVEEGDA